jgi:hypothetical protein
LKISKVRTKQPYTTPGGTYVPGVTTILGILNKPALMRWAWNQGVKGISLGKSTESALDIGSLSHFINEAFVKGEEAEFDIDFRKEDLLKAHLLSAKFQNYYKSRNAVMIHSEMPLLDLEYRYGGTIDLVVECDKPLDVAQYPGNDRCIELWDYKTSKDIWPEYYIQVAAYADLLLQNQGLLAEPRIILCSKEGKFKADAIPAAVTQRALLVWQNLVDVYCDKRELEGMLR